MKIKARNKTILHVALMSLVCLVMIPTLSQAQVPTASNAQQGSLADLFEVIDITTIPSLVFTKTEHEEIIIARRSAGNVRAPHNTTAGDKTPPPPEERYIELQGIVYTSKDDWIIWLNGKRISPKALPEEALGMEVYRDYIEIKWYDDYTNQIIPLRLRPMQRFNIDTRMFLPG